jgi:outer membrane protein assembly factor BamB
VSSAPRVVSSIKLDGAVYASPIAVGGVIVVATENDSIYGFNPAGQQLWHVSVGSPSPAYQRPCGDIDPLGITSTPVYSAQTGLVYLVAEHGGTIGHDLIALDPRTGQVRWRKDVDLPGPDPVAMQQRGALAVTGGQVSVTDVCKSYGGAAVNGNVGYLPCTDGVRAVQVTSAGQLHMLWHAADSVEGSPVIGGGRVWALDQTGGELYALNPASGQTMETVTVGETSRFATPAIYGSLLIVPTKAGVVFVQA